VEENLKTLVWLVPLLPVAGFLVNIFFGRHMHKLAASGLACLTVAGSAVIAWTAFAHVAQTGHAFESRAWEWFRTGDGHQPLTFLVEHKLRVDQLTCVMMLIVTNVAFLIHLFSVGYMADEKRYSRYFSYLNLFTGFMLMLVMSSNLLGMFIGWEGVGLCSYLLIGFWFEKVENAQAGMKAFIVNRVGDLCFTVGLLMLFCHIGTSAGIWTVDVQKISEVIGKGQLDSGVLTTVGILMFAGATGKSAQIPLYTWLPDAMAGPTPVSALIHAATMVTAGVYMVARMNALYSAAPGALTVVALVGGLTALFAGTIGVAQNDIKKVLAYSTVSQLGFMFVGVGVGAYAAGIAHLMTHAFFKACLFLGSGSVIMGMMHEQDIRKMGGLKKYMPVTFWTFAIASIAISGLPPFAGFWSKDEILWKAWDTHVLLVPGPLIWLMGAIAAAFTAFYMTRLVVKTFLGELRAPIAGHGDALAGAHGHDDAHGHDAGHGHDAHASGGHDDHADHGHHGLTGPPKESPITMTTPLVVLALLSILGGFLCMPHWIPKAGGILEHWLEPVCPEAKPSGAAAGKHEMQGEHGAPAGGKPEEHHGPKAMELILMGFSVAVAAGAIGLAWKIYYTQGGKPAEEFANRNRELYELVRDKYRIDELYQSAVVEPELAVNQALAQFDNTVIDGAVNGAAEVGASTSLYTGYFDNEVVDGAVNAAAATTKLAARGTRRIQTGNIRTYIAASVIGGLVLIALFCLWMLWIQSGRGLP
jgi:NADH-quinone oxidoreductase subunit L